MNVIKAIAILAYDVTYSVCYKVWHIRRDIRNKRDYKAALEKERQNRLQSQ
jgi:hypothetical protein